MTKELGRLRAARALANGSTQAAAAREAGVDRASIGRWVKEPAFHDMILRAKEPEPDAASPAEAVDRGLTARVEKALKVIDDALSGANVTPAMARVALDVIKAAKTLEPKAQADQGPSTLTTLIQELDEQAAAGKDGQSPRDDRKAS